jgi:hypothetical protein
MMPHSDLKKRGAGHRQTNTSKMPLKNADVETFKLSQNKVLVVSYKQARFLQLLDYEGKRWSGRK